MKRYFFSLMMVASAVLGVVAAATGHTDMVILFAANMVCAAIYHAEDAMRVLLVNLIETGSEDKQP